MDVDHLLVSFFGTTEVGALEPEPFADGVDRLLVELGLEQDRGRRFALWCLAWMLGRAPELDAVFEEAADREAARAFMDAADRVSAGADHP